jgi:HEPN superfamily AbiU2-like protein
MYIEYHDHFSNEVYQATGCYVIWKNLQNEPAQDERLLQALNVTPLSWIFIRHSIMLSLIMALGRIFDTDSDSVSIDDLIRSCISDIELFSKQSLRQRKSQSHNAHEWIESYMENVYESTEQDFQRLKPQIKKFRELYETFYKPIRHKLFAHSDKKFHARSDLLWNATRNANMEDLISFLEDFNSTIREAYLNGRKPELTGKRFDEEWFARDIQSLLRCVKKSVTSA